MALLALNLWQILAAGAASVSPPLNQSLLHNSHTPTNR
jgi:hypothetical protein